MEPEIEVNIAEVPPAVESAKSILKTVIGLKQSLVYALTAPAIPPSSRDAERLRKEITILQLHLAQLDAANGNSLSHVDAEFRGIAQLAAILRLRSE